MKRKSDFKVRKKNKGKLNKNKNQSTMEPLNTRSYPLQWKKQQRFQKGNQGSDKTNIVKVISERGFHGTKKGKGGECRRENL